MASGLNVNPYGTTQASGLFSTDTTGLVQGLALPDPSTRYRLSMGYVDQGETQPLWGGVAISERIGLLPGMRAANNGRMGNALKRATSSADITGFAVFNQSHHLPITPNSSAPQAAPGNSIGFLRFGSDARLPVLADPALLSAAGEITTTEFAWDFANQRLTSASNTSSASQGETASPTATIPVKLLDIVQSNGLAASYDASTGTLSWERVPDNTGNIIALIQL